MNNLTKQDGWYRDIVKQWQVKKYGFPPRGLFDLIYLNMRMVVDDNDTSEFAYDLLDRSADLLLQRIRYPREYEPDNMAKNRLDELWSKLLWNLTYKLDENGDQQARKHKIKFTEHQKYGPITKLTRDPGIYTLTCAAFRNRLQYLNVISIPWYLYHPPTWRWHKYLKNPTDRNLRLWWFCENLNHPKQDFAILLQDYRKLAVNCML